MVRPKCPSPHFGCRCDSFFFAPAPPRWVSALPALHHDKPSQRHCNKKSVAATITQSVAGTKFKKSGLIYFSCNRIGICRSNKNESKMCCSDKSKCVAVTFYLYKSVAATNAKNEIILLAVLLVMFWTYAFLPCNSFNPSLQHIFTNPSLQHF